MKSSKKDFIAEAEELIEEAGRLLVEIQETASSGINPDTINALFRTIHTVKGISGLFGFKDVADFSHAFESMLDDMRLGRFEVTDKLVKFLFSAMDVLRTVVVDIENDRAFSLEGRIKEIGAFREALRGSGGDQKTGDSLQRIDSTILKTLSEYEEHRLKANIREGKGIYLARSVFPLADFDRGLNELVTVIKDQGEQISTLPTSTDIPADSIGFNILFSSLKMPEQMKGVLPVPFDELVPLRKEVSQPVPEQKAAEASLRSRTTYVRVDIEKLDGILNTIGELNLARNATNRIASEMVDIYGQTPLVIDLYRISQTFDRKIMNLKEQVLTIRMIPLGQIFSRLGQVVRRYSRESGKVIELALFGEDTEIDKFLAEEIVDPLMHIVRNSIDHGIETPEQRRNAGKPEKGLITLRATQKGNHVVIEVMDDGGGINTERVREKAIEKGLFPAGADLADREILDFIFMPGFSTKATVSEMSGRGVGMDVVREKISGLGGFVDVQTELGKGTTFSLTVPITLAILKALIVDVGEERFAVPLTSMSECLLISRQDIQTIEGREVYNLRGEMLPMVSIAAMFGLDQKVTESVFAVVVGYGDRRLGLVVDELLGQYEIVIKSLGEYFSDLVFFAGAAEIGKYEVILVIDVESVIEEALSRQKVACHV